LRFRRNIKGWCFVFLQADDKHADTKTAVKLAKHLQDLRGADGDVVKERELMEETVGRRKTVRNIHNTHQFHQKKLVPRSLDVAFERRLSQLRDEDGKDIIHCVAM
jgi:hypothetical protein